MKGSAPENESLFLLERVYKDATPDGFAEFDLLYITSGVFVSVVKEFELTANLPSDASGIRVYGGWWLGYKEFDLKGEPVK